MKTAKVSKITKEQFDSLSSDTISKKSFDEIIELIDLLVNYIVRYMLTSKSKHFWWDYDNYYDSNNNGYFDVDEYKDNIGIYGSDINFPAPYDYGWFPTSWLLEDFEEEFNKEVTEAKKEIRIKKAQEKQIKENDKKRIKALRNSARLKLTPEERRAVGLR